MSDNEVTDSTIQSDPVANVEDDEDFSTLTPDGAATTSKPDFGPFQSAATTNSNKISDMKKVHLDEITDLRNQLDELKTKCMIIETTKQDELDEIRFKSQQEIDSLNHIINALQNDLSSIRSDYDSRTKSYKEFKKQQQQQQQQLQSDQLNKSPANSSTGLAAFNAASLHSSPHNTSIGGSSQNPSYHLNITQENENLEEDMRKAKESADMLRSVVLPLETEITTLRTRSNTSEQRMRELEKIIEQHNNEKRMLMEEEERIVSECIAEPGKDVEASNSEPDQNGFFNKYIQLKKYLYKKDAKFIEMQQDHLKSIKMIYSMLTPEQKQKLIPYRPKSRSLLSNKSTGSSSTRSETSKGEQTETDNKPDELNDEAERLNIKKNPAIDRIEELLSSLVVNAEMVEPVEAVSDKSNSSSINEMNFTYVELLAMYEKEKNYCAEIEVGFNQKAKESNKNVENLNKEMNNLATIIDDLRKQYLNMQNQFQYQLDSLIKLNEELRTDLQRCELKNESYKSESLRLKAENKQFYGEQTILSKDFEEQYQPQTNLEESNRQLANIRADMVKLVVANQALNRQHQLSLETIKHLQKANLQYQRADSGTDQMVLLQSLESELERERKVRVEAEGDLREHKNQIRLLKEKSQTLIDSLRQRNDHMEFEQRKQKEESLELANQIQSLKKDAKNSLSVQEDLVRLIQSLQIELNQMKSCSNSENTIQIRCQHEEDFKECANCNGVFSMSKRKHRCQHCCKIFCAECCGKTVLSGPNQRVHKVCDSCHTLLDKTSAPSTPREVKM